MWAAQEEAGAALPRESPASRATAGATEEALTARLNGPHSDPTAAEDVRTIADYLVREVQVQRALERDNLGSLAALMKPLRIGEILLTLRRAVERHLAAAGRRVEVAPRTARPS